MFQVGEFVILNEKAAKGLPSRVGTRCKVIEKIKTTSYDYIVNFDDYEKSFVKESELNKLTQEDKVLMEYIFMGNVVMHIPSTQKVKIIKVDYIHNQAEVEFDDGETTVLSITSLVGLNDKESDSVLEFKFKVGDKVKTSMNYAFNGISGAVGVIEKCTNADYGITCYVSFDGHSAYAIPEHELQLIETEPTEQFDKFTQIGLEIGKFTDIKNKQYGSSVDATNEMMKVLMERYTYDDENYLMPKSLLQHILLQVRIMDKQNRIFNNPSGEGDAESPYNDITGYGIIGVDMVNK